MLNVWERGERGHNHKKSCGPSMLIKMFGEDQNKPLSPFPTLSSKKDNSLFLFLPPPASFPSAGDDDER